MRRLWFLLLLLPLLVAFRMAEPGLLADVPLSTSGGVRTQGAIVGWDFGGAVGATLANDYGSGSASLSVVGTPTLTTDHTWPAGLSGAQGAAWNLSGADCMYEVDGGGYDEPTGDFSVQFSYTPGALGTQYIASKWQASQLAWRVTGSGAHVLMSVSDDGSTGTNLFAYSVLEAHRPAFITVAYRAVGSGSSVANIYVDNNVTATSSVMQGPPYQGTANFVLGGLGPTCSSPVDGKISNLAIFHRELSEAEHDHDFAEFQGRAAPSGPVSVSSAAPPALVLEPCGSGRCLYNTPANSAAVGAIAAGSGGLYRPRAISNLCERRSLETWAAGSPTGWTETSAGGTSDATQDTTNQVHKQSSASMLCDGTNSLTLDSACKVISASTAYYVSAYMLTLAGTADFSLQLIEYTSADCSTGATTTTLYNGDPGGTWTKEGGTRTTGGSVQSGRVRMLIDTNSATVAADAVQWTAGAYPADAFCSGDTDATASCNTMITSIPSPINGNAAVQVEFTGRSPWAGSDATSYLSYWTNGNAGGANTSRCLLHTSTDEPAYYAYDAASGALGTWVNVLDWSADTDYTVKTYTTGIGALSYLWNGSWQTAGSGAGSGLISASQTTFYLGGDQTNGHDVWIRGLKVSGRQE